MQTDYLWRLVARVNCLVVSRSGWCRPYSCGQSNHRPPISSLVSKEIRTNQVQRIGQLKYRKSQHKLNISEKPEALEIYNMYLIALIIQSVSQLAH